MDRIVANLHILIFLYIGYTVFDMYESHDIQLKQIQSQAPALTAKITRYEKTINESKKFQKDLEAQKSKVQEMARQIEKVQKQLPSATNETIVLQRIDSYSKLLNLKDVVQIPMQEKQPEPFYFQKSYQHKATGTFLQLLVLLEKLEKSERILNVQQVNFQAQRDGKMSRFQLVKSDILIDSYRHNPVHREDDGLGAIDAQIKANKSRGKRGKR